MVVCNFYMQGYCKFGSRCRYDHVDYGAHSSRSGDLSTSERTIGVSILKEGKSSFSGHQSLNQSSAAQFYQEPQTTSFSHKNTSGSIGLFNVQEVMAMITRDMAQAVKGGQWLLSCYSPSKELPNVPGLDDYSPEEMRSEFYSALSNGTLSLWQAMAQQLLNNVTKTYSELQYKDHLHALVSGWLRRIDSPHTTSPNPTPVIQENAAPTVPFFNRPPVQSPASSNFSFNLPREQTVTAQANSDLSTGKNLFSTNTSTPTLTSNPFSSGVPSLGCDTQAYSTMEDLTEEDYKAFQADRFTLGKIPTKPPSAPFCNT